jgi:hypothetical protein
MGRIMRFVELVLACGCLRCGWTCGFRIRNVGVLGDVHVSMRRGEFVILERDCMDNHVLLIVW